MASVLRAAASAAARGLGASNAVSASIGTSSKGLSVAARQPWQSAATMMIAKGSSRPLTSTSLASSFSAAAAAAAATATRRASSSSFAASAAAAPSASPASVALPLLLSSLFRRSHLDFPRRQSTLLQRLFFGKGGGPGGGGMDSDAVLYSLIGLNVGVYALWQVADASGRGPLARRHLVVSAAALSEGRLHTLVTSAFSHRDGMSHLLVNMVSLFFFGRTVGRALGGRALLSLYLAAGTGGAFAHCAAAAWPCLSSFPAGSPHRRACVQRSPGALGASAAVNGVVALSCLTWPTSTVLLWGILPVPAALLGAAFVFQDVLGAWRDIDGRYGRGGGGGGGGVAHAGHLGGAAVGALAWALLRRRRFL